MLQLEVLILEFVSVDALTTSAIVVGEVTTLTHEVGDYPVEGGTFVTEALLSSAQGSEVLGRLWNHIRTQLQ